MIWDILFYVALQSELKKTNNFGYKFCTMYKQLQFQSGAIYTTEQQN